MDWMHGKPLNWATTDRDDDTKRDLLRQVAAVCLHLWTHPVPSTFLEHYCSCTATESTITQTDKRLLRRFNNVGFPFDPIDQLLNQAALSDAFARHGDSTEPALCHDDMASANILIDTCDQLR